MRPVLGPDGHQLDQVRLKGLRAYGHHGVLPHERAEGQPFVADVVLHLDTRPAAASDDLADTVSYADVARDVVDVLGGEPVDLLETLAGRVAAAVLAHEGVQAVDVTIHKPRAPIDVPFDDVEVAIRRHSPTAAGPEHERRTTTAATPAAAAAPAEAEDAPAAEAEDAPAAEAEHAAAESPSPTEGALAVPAEPASAVPAIPAAVAGAAAPAVPAAQGDGEPGTAPQPDPRLLRRPEEPQRVVLALGANLGDAATTLRRTVHELAEAPGLEITAVSPLARTAPVLAPGQSEQPDYLNAVVVARTSLSPTEVLDLAQKLEDRHGRARVERWGPRTLDVDVVTYGDLVVDDERLTLPHPRANARAFVLLPWSQVEPDAVLPGPEGGRVAALADRAEDRASIRWLALDWLDEEGAGEGTTTGGDR